jgi:hypothetical protein
MPQPPGHETGHAGHLADAFTWREYVDALKAELGGWTDLAEALKERAGSDLKVDVDSVVKALQRLRRRRQKPGDKYGALLLRHFGLPPQIEEWGRLMGQYHSRFADLPVALRRQQLTRWDRPPVSESSFAIWVHLGLASVAHRDRDLPAARRRLELAGEVRRPDPTARMEHALLAARLASDEGDYDEEERALAVARDRLDQSELTEHDRLCYQARLMDQLAYRASRGWREDGQRLAAALRRYESIADGAEVPPFVGFRRALGLAWCHWRMGERELATGLCATAARHAGDGGLVRFRVMALNLHARIEGDTPAGQVLLSRARRLAAMLDDADLRSRLPAPGQSGSSTAMVP